MPLAKIGALNYASAVLLLIIPHMHGRACGEDLCCAVALSITPSQLQVADAPQALASLVGWFSRTFSIQAQPVITANAPLDLRWNSPFQRSAVPEVIVVDSSDDEVLASWSSNCDLPYGDAVHADILACLVAKKGSHDAVVHSFVALARAVGWDTRLVTWLQPLTKRMPSIHHERYGVESPITLSLRRHCFNCIIFIKGSWFFLVFAAT